MPNAVTPQPSHWLRIASPLSLILDLGPHMDDQLPTSATRATIRDATLADMPAVQTIYAHHVLHGLATFEEKPPSVAELCQRRDSVLSIGLFYIVASFGDRTVGYSYATAYRPRAAYRHTIEDSVYIAEDFRERGVGRLLLSELITRCERGMWRQMMAGSCRALQKYPNVDSPTDKSATSADARAKDRQAHATQQ
ncbi:MAG: L-amino acid N-acyltransferase YncA [Gammaproteobacteria bacterium]